MNPRGLLMTIMALALLLAGAGHGQTLNSADKSPNAKGICTYRIMDLKSSRFQATELFNIQEELAIIVKGYGGNHVRIRITALPRDVEVFQLLDFIPENKHKLWIWKSGRTGYFHATLFVGEVQKDDVYFKIVQ